MEITHIDKNILFGAFAKACSDFEGGIVGGGNCFADDLGVGCPFDNDVDEISCSNIRPKHWREVFEGEDRLEKPVPEFQFGDKIRVDGMRAVFARYSDTSHKTAYILFESGSLLPERRVATLKAGWE